MDSSPMVRPIFNHVGIHVSDIERARRFYDPVLSCIELRRYADFPEFQASAYGIHQSSFRIVQPPHTISVSSSHVALTAQNKHQVEAFFNTAVELGAAIVEAPHYYEDNVQEQKFLAYTASFRDHDGHHVEAVFVSPP